MAVSGQQLDTLSLDVALDAWLGYLSTRPNGGSQAELLAGAVALGFQEPLLAQWLSAFMDLLQATGWMDGTGYDQAFAPKFEAVGFTRAHRQILGVFHFATRPGEALHVVNQELAVQRLDSGLVDLDARLAELDAAITATQGLAPGPARDTALAELATARARAQRQRDSLQAERDRLAAVLG